MANNWGPGKEAPAPRSPVHRGVTALEADREGDFLSGMRKIGFVPGKMVILLKVFPVNSGEDAT